MTDKTKAVPEGIPIVDLSSFAATKNKLDQLDQQQLLVAKDLHEACANVGFFYIRGHGCSPELMDRTFDQVMALFDSDQKENLNAKQSPLYRGYNSVETGSHSCTPTDDEENNDGGSNESLPDLKESFTIGAEGDASPMHGSNQFPKELPDFEPIMREYWHALLHVVAPRLMKALAMSLDLDVNFFLNQCSDPVAQMVLLRYPPNTSSAQARKGCGAHTDCGFLTILAQDDAGLEVQHTDGTWMSAPPIPGTFVVNLGDMAARWSNDTYKSTLHRVRASSATTRHSIPFFSNCNFDAKVECITGDKGDAVKYPPVEAGEYVFWKKLGLVYLADGSST